MSEVGKKPKKHQQNYLRTQDAKSVIDADLPAWAKQHSAVQWLANKSIRFKAKVLRCPNDKNRRRGLAWEANQFYEKQQAQKHKRQAFFKHLEEEYGKETADHYRNMKGEYDRYQ